MKKPNYLEIAFIVFTIFAAILTIVFIWTLHIVLIKISLTLLIFNCLIYFLSKVL